MSLTRRVYGGKKSRKSRNSKKSRGHCRIGGKKTLKKGGKSFLVPATFLTALLMSGKNKKKQKKTKRKSKHGGGQLLLAPDLVTKQMVVALDKREKDNPDFYSIGKTKLRFNH